MSGQDTRTRVFVAVCTYKRNDLLSRLLKALLACADRVAETALVGVVVVDDTPAGEARLVAEPYSARFALGLKYLISGRQNISLARNLAIEAAMQDSDWTVMTDDDCEPPATWLESLLRTQRDTSADAVTGRMIRRVPEGSPTWITSQPFLELGVEELADGEPMESAATFNTLISSGWLRDHPAVRFDPNMGVVGGEDMVFFRAARSAGLNIRFSKDALVFENEPADRVTFGYQLYVYFWHGNSSSLACIESGMKRSRMFIHGAASLARAIARPATRLARGESPQFRFCLAQILHGTGKMLGTVGVRVVHR